MSDSDEPVEEEGFDDEPEPELTDEDRLRMMREQEEKFLALQAAKAKKSGHPTSQRAMARQLLESPTYFDSAEYSLHGKTGETNVGIGAGPDGEDEPTSEEDRARLMKAQEEEMLQRLGTKGDGDAALSTAAQRAVAKQMLKQPAIFDSAEYSLHGKVGRRNIGIGKTSAGTSTAPEGEAREGDDST